MLVFSAKTLDTETDVILRDEKTGRILCEVAVIETRPGRVRLGFTGPRDVKINRRVVDRRLYPTTPGTGTEPTHGVPTTGPGGESKPEGQ